VEVDDHYEPPAAEAGACKAVQRDTQWKSARSDTERLLARFVLTLSGSAGFAPFSYTLRDRFSGPHARTASWATFYFNLIKTDCDVRLRLNHLYAFVFF
jgi:hypothetical protein